MFLFFTIKTNSSESDKFLHVDIYPQITLNSYKYEGVTLMLSDSATVILEIFKDLKLPKHKFN